jgi:phage baseplate assembly protein W
MPNAETYNRLGTDLALTRYTGVAGGVPLHDADSWGTLDLRAGPGRGTGLKKTTEVTDLVTASGRENLGQALILRLLTQQGALAPLGHPDYGSRLVELIGQLNNETSRNLARLHTIAAVSQEPRVRQLLDLQVETAADSPDALRISFSVIPVDDDAPLGIALEVTL